MNSLLAKATTTVVAALLSLSPVALSPAASAQTAPVPVPSASPTGDGSVTWSVRPGTASGPDGRSWVEWEGDPGERRTEYLVVDNFGTEPVEFRLSAADGYFTDTGRFNMLPSDRASTDAGTWVTLPEFVSVPAKGSETVRFEIVVPEDATPGDHPAGVAASIQTAGSDTVGVESRVGFRVMTRVTGELRTEATAAVSGSYTGSINPFEAGSLEITYTVTNTGNSRLRAEPRIFVAGAFGAASSDRPGEEVADIAPGETRTSTVTVTPAWPLLWYDVRVEATPVAVSDEVAVGEASTATAAASVAAPPWSQLAVVAAAALLLSWYLRQRRRDARKTAELIEAARAEGRAAAPAEDRATAPAEPAPEPLLRRTARPAARLIAILAIGATAAVGAWGGSSDANAAGSDQSGVDVRVEITPMPSTTPLPSGSPSPSTEPTTAPPAPDDGVTPGSPWLPPTGYEGDPALLLTGGALVVGGALVLARVVRARNVRRRGFPASEYIRTSPEMTRKS
ncbi:hypothetical protein DEA06_14465 [Microbacterium sp. Gd 4-13]|uniref:hypothetical protein n=1 Tax=Microbacterium sp. Gd 4-13 TaxID=2173179 RepID=UPI000D573576|nr:hypothetical protein [Microbacterium sp. Gd 4-13]PVW02973.1 hypothetical protein DEA06_14465 [Microbacterium sp. Gd 4-13]